MKIDLTLKGDKELLARIERLGSKGIPWLCRIANRAAMGVFVREARNAVPVRSGLLRKSIGFVQRSYKGAAVAIVGPRRGWGRLVVSSFDPWQGKRTFRRMGKMGKRRLAAKFQDPAKYAHWIEHGHPVKFKRGGKPVGFVRATNFMRNAFHSARLVAQAFWVAKAKQVLRMWGNER